jgi:hypothetical protein
MEKNLNHAVALTPRRDRQTMFSLMEEQQRSGENIRSFCERLGISQSGYYYWLRKYRARVSPPSGDSGFTLLQLQADLPNPLFCEVITGTGERVRFFQPVPASFLRSLI